MFGMRSLTAFSAPVLEPEDFSGKKICPGKNLKPTAPEVEVFPSSEHAQRCLRNCPNDPKSQRILTCFTPICCDNGFVSCVVDRFSQKLIFTNDINAAVIEEGAIIDSIEFFGLDGFSTKNVFSIGLGQMNQDISFPLIVDSDSTIANERVGGCREFFSGRETGKNEKNIVLFPSYVTLELTEPITCGQLQIVIRYHMKIV